MKVIELNAGQYDTFRITEPTHLISVAGWDTVIRPTDVMQPCIEAEADVRVTGCALIDGRFGIRAQPAAHVELDDCWITGAKNSGIYFRSSLRMHRCLVEYNGKNAQYGHGVYCDSGGGLSWITNSIVWANSAWGVTHARAGGHLRLQQNLIGNHRTGGRGALYAHHNPTCELSLERNTFCGRLDIKGSPYNLPGSNIEDDVEKARDPYWAVGGYVRRLYWMSERSAALAGRGCYDCYPRFADNDQGAEYAEELWYNGYMYAINGRWDTPDTSNMYHRFKAPHFPGSPLPVIPNRNGVNHG